MEINKLLDRAIMTDETTQNPNLKSGYSINGKCYKNYLSNESWNAFVKNMENHYPAAYRMYQQGGGKELEERKVGKDVYPPKMASFGSSSRMIFNLMKDVDGFLFEKKLPTTVGGVANLDGFMETETKYVFVEAKCREPYTKKDGLIERKYEELYKVITNSTKTAVTCEITPIDQRKMDVRFMVGDTVIQHFDLKQMISHLLGVATAMLKEKPNDKALDFVYLLFNPILIPQNEGKENILSIYRHTCQECNAIDFKALFGVILEYLQNTYKLGDDKNAEDIACRFTFRLCDQTVSFSQTP